MTDQLCRGAVPSDQPLAVLHASFTSRCEASFQIVRGVVLRARIDDPDSVVAQVWERAWRNYPEMIRHEQAALAAGLPSPHKWHGWFATIAANLVRTLHIRSLTAAHSIGTRCTRLPDCEPTTLDSGQPDPDETAFFDVDYAAGSRAFDPEVVYLRTEARAILTRAIASLAPRHRQVVAAFLDRQKDAILAQCWGITLTAVVGCRQRAFASLRATLEAAGYQLNEGILYPSQDHPGRSL